jgi:hypothetical protein
MIYVVIIGIFALGATVGGVRVARRGAARRAGMLATPSKLENNALVTLTGTVALIGEPLLSPLGGKRCVAFRATGRVFKTASIIPTSPDGSALPLLHAPPLLGGGGVNTLLPLGKTRSIDQEISEVRMTPFMLVTRDGDIRIDGEECTLPNRNAPIIPRKLELEQKFMSRTGLPGRAADGGFDETVITERTKIVVHGTVHIADDGPIHITGDPIAIDFP